MGPDAITTGEGRGDVLLGGRGEGLATGEVRFAVVLGEGLGTVGHARGLAGLATGLAGLATGLAGLVGVAGDVGLAGLAGRQLLTPCA
jgi:hypothetical protein